MVRKKKIVDIDEELQDIQKKIDDLKAKKETALQAMKTSIGEEFLRAFPDAKSIKIAKEVFARLETEIQVTIEEVKAQKKTEESSE